MYILTFIVTLIFIFLLLLYVLPLKIFLTFNSEQHLDLNIAMSWLNPLFKGLITNDNSKILLKLYIFNKKIYTKQLKTNNASNKIKSTNYSDKINAIRTLKPEHVNIQTSYGFEDPSVTGMVCGVFDLISQQDYLDILNNKPDFGTNESYFNLNAEAEINALLSLISLLKIRGTNINMQPLHGSK